MPAVPVLAMVVPAHVLCGLVAVACGLGAMLTRKGGVAHRRLGRSYLAALVGLGLTAPILAAADWPHRWHLVILGGLALGSAAIGYTAVRFRRPARPAVHIAGMGGAYILMLTAFYVDNGPRLPLWNLLPPVLLWLIPALVGTPVTIRAVRRHAPHTGQHRPAPRQQLTHRQEDAA